MECKTEINVETALRNIESCMRFEGMVVLEETLAACREILLSGEQAEGVAEKFVKLVLVQD